MNNATKVTHVAIAGAFSYLVVSVLAFYQAELMNAVPGAEGALTTILTVAATYLKKV
jgi:hypothetical protein